MKNIFKPLRICLPLILAIGIASACSSAERSGSGSSDRALAESAQNPAAESEPASKETSAELNDVFYTFKKDEDYKVLRPQMMKDGWQPARSEEGDDNCAHGGEICNEYPELEAGPSSPRGDAIFRWRKGDRVVKIYTYDNQLYNRYEFEKSVSQSNDSALTGKYEFSAIGVSGEHTLEVKGDKTATFEVLEEDGTTSGTGSWTWDKTSELLTVTLSMKYLAASDEMEGKTPKMFNALFLFKRTGKDLKIVRETWTPEGDYVGRIFKRL